LPARKGEARPDIFERFTLIARGEHGQTRSLHRRFTNQTAQPGNLRFGHAGRIELNP
jgi:hypothetical protein